MGQPIPDESRFVKEWSRYRTLAGHKALFVAGDIEGRFIMGYAHGLETPDGAMRQAEDECERRRAARDIEAACRLYAREGEAVDS